MNENEKTLRIEPPHRIVQVGAFALAMLALFLLVESLSVIRDLNHPSAPATDTITVSGQGTANAVPDVAKITYTVTETAKSVGDAQTAATKKSNDALAALKDSGIEDKDVKTLAYSVSPQYTYPTCPPGVFCPNNTATITGYDVSQTIQVTVRDTAKAGDVLQELGTLGVQNISGPNFTVDEDGSVKAAARAEAIADAKEKAQALAKELGVRLGRVVNFYEETGGQPYPMYSQSAFGGKAMDMAAAPSLPTGENETTSTVSITYEIR
ncbi:MAG: SIMPL domain-containing protein [bacterium]